MNLVHNIDPLAHGSGGVDGLVPQGADLIHAVVGGGVQLQHVQNGAALNPQTGGATVAGVAVHRVFAVDCPGQNLGAGGLAGAPGAGEEIGVGQAAGGHLALQCLGNMGLAHHIVKGAGPPFAVKSLIQLPSSFAEPSFAKSKSAGTLRHPAGPHTGL